MGYSGGPTAGPDVGRRKFGGRADASVGIVVPVPDDYFGEEVAAYYDDPSSPMFEPAAIDEVVDFLLPLAGDGPALELGIGTGRIALPLSKRGVRVHGIDLSQAMVDRLRAKAGSDAVTVTVGDFATAKVPTTFTLAYLVFNTIENLTTQDEQVECFQNVSEHLRPGGHFVVEVEVPQLRRLPPGETVRPFTVSATVLGFDEYDTARQGLVSHHYRFENGTARVFSAPFRYVWPSELDLMARLAGMALVQRWGGWDRQAFTGESTSHVSVWQKPVS